MPSHLLLIGGPSSNAASSRVSAVLWLRCSCLQTALPVSLLGALDSLHPHLLTWGLVHGLGSTAGGEVVSVALRLREDFCVGGERRAALGALWPGR